MSQNKKLHCFFSNSRINLGDLQDSASYMLGSLIFYILSIIFLVSSPISNEPTLIIYLATFSQHITPTIHSILCLTLWIEFEPFQYTKMGEIADEMMQFHVLAVDDSIIDRKLIERLLKTSYYQGTFCNYILTLSLVFSTYLCL